MRARRVAAVTDVEDLPNLGEAEPGGLSPSDEADPGDRVGGIVAIPRRGTFGGREQAFVFVERSVAVVAPVASASFPILTMSPQNT